MNSFNELWEMIKDECRSLVSEPIYNIWFKDIEFISFDNEKLVLAVSGFKKKIVETRFIDKLRQASFNILGFEVEIEIIDSVNYPSAEITSNDEDDKANKDTFDTFVHTIPCLSMVTQGLVRRTFLTLYVMKSNAIILI